MKYFKISLLAAGAVAALVACSSLEVSNPTEENFPEGWSVSEYLSVNPDLRSLQIMDQVAIMNKISGKEADDEAFLADTVTMKKIALEYAGFTETSLNFTDKDKMKYLKSFNIYGVDNEPAVFDTLTLDTAVFERQYVVYGAIEGRPFRKCKDSETALVKKGSCQASEDESVGYVGHLYCAKEGVTFCIDCKATDECPEVIPESSSEAVSSSSEAAPESSEATGEGESSSSEAAPESSETAPESSEATADSSSSEAAGEESSSSVTE